MNSFRAYLSGGYWKYAFSFKSAAIAFFAAVGVLWTGTELIGFLGPKPLEEWLKKSWWFYLTVSAAWAAWDTRPKLSFGCTLKSRDLRIEIRVADIFEGNHSLVVGTNTSFDTGPLISEKSLQGQMTKRYYDTVNHLDLDIANALQGVASTPAANHKQGKQAIYPIGTTAKLSPKGRVVYLCAMANLNSQGTAHTTPDDLRVALPALWDHISNAGDHGDISIPILGTGFGRIPDSRESVIREILKSFVAACAAQRPCASLTVVIHPKDYFEHGLELKELGAFLMHLCKYTEFSQPAATGGGRPVP